MKKIFLLVVILVLAWLVTFFYKSELASNPTQIFGGKVIEVKSNSIVVEGAVVYSNQKASSVREVRTIEFEIKPDTTLINKVTTATQEQVKSGKQFFPKREDVTGRFEDLKNNTSIYSITSSSNLFKVDRAVAEEVIYTTYEFEQRES